MARDNRASVRWKSLCALPHRIAVALVDDGWIMRNDVAWCKNNALPLPVKDRFVCRHESVFLLTKEPHYYFDLDAVRVPATHPPRTFNRRVRDAAAGRLESHPLLGKLSEKEKMMADSARPDAPSATVLAQSTPGMVEARGRLVGGGPKSTAGSGMRNPGDVLHTSRTAGAPPYCPKCKIFLLRQKKQVYVDKANQARRCVVCDERVVEHVATFPVELPMFCISAGCPPGGMVLDPFMGSGTTAVAAEKLGRDWCGIELSERYAAVCRERLASKRNGRIDDHNG